MRKLFFVHLHSYTWRTFSVHTRIKTLSLYVNTVYIQTLFMFKDFFFRFFKHTPVVYTKVSLYTLVAHTHKNFFSHIIYTHKILLYTFSFTYIKNSFLFFVYIDTTFVHNALFLALSWFFVHFIFRTMFLNEKLYTVPEFQINIIDNNDISTNTTIQTKMYSWYRWQSKQQK